MSESRKDFIEISVFGTEAQKYQILLGQDKHEREDAFISEFKIVTLDNQKISHLERGG